GVLARDSNPALYLYHQQFEHQGRTYTRRMFMARLRLQPFSHGAILPHERTFGGPKEDRLALMKTTACQLSPILGLYNDAQGRIGSVLAGVAAREPDMTGTLESVENRLWVITEPDIIDQVVSTMADKKVYIADGHHRYGTAMMYREWLTRQEGERLSDDHPAHYVMFALAAMDDPGCLILPYHRVIGGVDLATLLDAWAPGAEPASPDQADIVLFDGPTGRETPLRFTDRAKLATLEPSQPAAWRQLDYAYLHRYLIDELLVRAGGRDPELHYVKSAAQARQTARAIQGVALMMNATPLDHLRAVSEAGGLMPQKSTYFFPKLATGLTLNPLR
ncbi:MAG: DUF1015 domain-containing protein, partial [Planctomycetes bacterium]|nr:DUF1015 domain-containing protein [Planctomycetota bacterium]